MNYHVHKPHPCHEMAALSAGFRRSDAAACFPMSSADSRMQMLAEIAACAVADMLLAKLLLD
jgi:hypothetical protein